MPATNQRTNPPKVRTERGSTQKRRSPKRMTTMRRGHTMRSKAANTMKKQVKKGDFGSNLSQFASSHSGPFMRMNAGPAMERRKRGRPKQGARRGGEIGGGGGK